MHMPTLNNRWHWKKLMRALLEIPVFFNRRHSPYDRRHSSKFQHFLTVAIVNLTVGIYKKCRRLRTVAVG